ncbi:MAG: hypothetical protein IJR22_08610 [Acidaminococcaceae bacterium]|nr:hypothetical protein [Acidaminococcaceae bacterium]
MKADQKHLVAGKKSEGFVIMMMLPLFLEILAFATAMAGCITCSIQAMAHRNEMVQAYSILEDDNADWQNEILAVTRKDIQDEDFEKVISTQKAGPYTLLVKEMRNKRTGKVLVNYQEFIPIEKADDCKS